MKNYCGSWFLFLIAFNLCGQSDQYLFDSISGVFDPAASDSILFEQYLALSKHSSNTEISLQYGIRALEKAIEINYERGIAKSYLRLGNVKMESGDHDEALQDVFTALEYYRKANLQNPIAVCLNIIGLIYVRQGQYERAVEYFHDAIKINKEKNRLRQLANDYNNLGEAYRLLPSFDSALFYFDHALKIYEEIEQDYGIAYATGNIGLVHAALGQFELAEKKINESTIILERLGDFYPIAVYMTYLVDIALDRNNAGQALNFAERSLQIGIENGLKEQIRDANLKLSGLYSSFGNYKKAFDYQTQYLIYRDSINNAETIRKMADLRTEFEVSQKQGEVDLLNEQKRTQQAIGIGLISGFTLLAILAVTLYRNNQKRLRINKLLEEQKQKLEQINDTKDKFFSIISHDLRGPVNAFHGISQIIKNYISTGKTKELVDVAEDIDKSVDGLSELLDNLLNWAVQQQGHVPNVPEKVNLNGIVKDLMKTFSNMAQSKNISMHDELDAHIDLWADRNSTMTILRNILNNALKFTPTGGEVFFNASAKGNNAVINITDTGQGIPEKKLRELFELKVQERSWGTQGEKGLGIGLQLVNEFIQMNNGRIEVSSKLDEGTTFTIHLPLFESVGSESLKKTHTA